MMFLRMSNGLKKFGRRPYNNVGVSRVLPFRPDCLLLLQECSQGIRFVSIPFLQLQLDCIKKSTPQLERSCNSLSTGKWRFLRVGREVGLRFIARDAVCGRNPRT